MRKCKTYLYIYENCQKPTPPPSSSGISVAVGFYFYQTLYGRYTSQTGGIFYFHPSLLMVTQLLPVFLGIQNKYFFSNKLYVVPIAYSSFLLYNCGKVKESLHSRLFLKNCPPVFISYNNYK